MGIFGMLCLMNSRRRRSGDGGRREVLCDESMLCMYCYCDDLLLYPEKNRKRGGKVHVM